MITPSGKNDERVDAGTVGADMTSEGQQFLTQWFDRHVNAYRDADGALPAALELKYTHSQRVAKDARLIAEGLDLALQNVQLAWVCGLVHDVGRFFQYEQYGSFSDADTMDHGLAGRRVLEAGEASLHFAPDEWEALVLAVEYHNRKTADLPGTLSIQAERLLKIIRDADKLDIMDLVLRSVARDGFRELPEMLPHIRFSRDLTPDVAGDVLKTKTVSFTKLQTVADFLVMLSTWFYDLNYAPSRRLALLRKLPDRLAKELPDDPVVREVFARIQKAAFSMPAA